MSSRQSADFHPNLWKNEFLTSPDFKEDDEDNIKLLELKEEIKSMLMEDVNMASQEKLVLIDEIQRLGVAYHFESEIDKILEKIYKGQNDCNIKGDCEDLNSTSLRFRLLRQHGYNISAGVFNKFKDDNRNFKQSLTADVKGLLSLYEASYLRIHGENILDEALEFTTKNLDSITNQTGVSASLAKKIQYALKRPLRKGVKRLEARFHMQEYQEDPSHNEVILTFAKMDFNILQKLHQKELSDIIRWWRILDFSQKLPFSRDRVVECYFWILGFYFEPKYTLARRTLTKVLVMTSVVDDIYDVYGTIEELELFTEAVERWDISAIDILPAYMKCCYEALLEIYTEIEKDIAFGENAYRLHYAKEVIKNTIRNYLTEARWCNQEYIPTMEEYMPVTLATGGSIWLVTSSFVGMGEMATEEAFQWLFKNPNQIIKASSIIGRFMGDIVGFKFEQKRKHVASTVECYMKQHNANEEETIKVFRKEVENAWKDLNEEYLKLSDIPMPLLDQILNFARTVNFLYKDEDTYTHSYLIKDHVASVLKNPIPV